MLQSLAFALFPFPFLSLLFCILLRACSEFANTGRKKRPAALLLDERPLPARSVRLAEPLSRDALEALLRPLADALLREIKLQQAVFRCIW